MKPCADICISMWTVKNKVEERGLISAKPFLLQCLSIFHKHSCYDVSLFKPLWGNWWSLLFTNFPDNWTVWIKGKGHPQKAYPNPYTKLKKNEISSCSCRRNFPNASQLWRSTCACNQLAPNLVWLYNSWCFYPWSSLLVQNQMLSFYQSDFLFKCKGGSKVKWISSFHSLPNRPMTNVELYNYYY